MGATDTAVAILEREALALMVVAETLWKLDEWEKSLAIGDRIEAIREIAIPAIQHYMQD